jgi:hypothetical protein
MRQTLLGNILLDELLYEIFGSRCELLHCLHVLSNRNIHIIILNIIRIVNGFGAHAAFLSG